MSTATITKEKKITGLNEEAQGKVNTRSHRASPKYRDNLSKWLIQLQSVSAFDKRDRSFGEYIANFLESYERSAEKKTNARDGDKNGYATRWKKAATNSNFQQLEQDGWEIKFIEFCITGKIDSDFSATEYFETGNESLLPANAWKLKKIPYTFAASADVDNVKAMSIGRKFALMEQRITQLEKTIKIMAHGQEKVSFSQLLENWVKLEAQRSQLPIDIIIDHLTNRLGGASSSTEIKDIIYGTYPIAEVRVKHYAMWVASLGILTDATGQAYTGKELIAMLPSKTTI